MTTAPSWAAFLTTVITLAIGVLALIWWNAGLDNRLTDALDRLADVEDRADRAHNTLVKAAESFPAGLEATSRPGGTQPILLTAQDHSGRVWTEPLPTYHEHTRPGDGNLRQFRFRKAAA